MVTHDQLREYAARDWDHLARRTVRRAADRWREGGALASHRASMALYEHARRTIPGYPGAERRARDRADHLALAAKLDAVAHLFRDA